MIFNYTSCLYFYEGDSVTKKVEGKMEDVLAARCGVGFFPLQNVLRWQDVNRKQHNVKFSDIKKVTLQKDGEQLYMDITMKTTGEKHKRFLITKGGVLPEVERINIVDETLTNN